MLSKCKILEVKIVRKSVLVDVYCYETKKVLTLSYDFDNFTEKEIYFLYVIVGREYPTYLIFDSKLDEKDIKQNTLEVVKHFIKFNR